MLTTPGLDQEERARRQPTREHGPIESDGRAVFAIPRVKVGRLMIIEVDRDDDPVETRDLRHPVTVRSGSYLRRTSALSSEDRVGAP